MHQPVNNLSIRLGLKPAPHKDASMSAKKNKESCPVGYGTSGDKSVLFLFVFPILKSQDGGLDFHFTNPSTYVKEVRFFSGFSTILPLPAKKKVAFIENTLVLALDEHCFSCTDKTALLIASHNREIFREYCEVIFHENCASVFLPGTQNAVFSVA